MPLRACFFLLLSIFFIAPSANVNAQKRSAAISDSLLLAHFDRSAKLEWQRVFHVLLDDMVPAVLHIGFDGTFCNGFIVYTQSGQKQSIKGTYRDQEIFLVELDDQARPLATIEGRIEDKKLNAVRLLTDRKNGQKVEGAVLPKGKEASPNTANKWYRRYSTKWDGKEATIYIARVQSGVVVGHLMQHEDDRKTYAIRGKVLPNGVLTAHLIAPDGKYFGTIKGNTDPLQKVTYTLDMAQPRSPKVYLHSALQESLDVQCLLEYNSNTQIDAVLPVTSSAALNQLLAGRMQAWMRQAAVGVTGARVADQRVTASAWAEITLWEEDLMCIVITTHATKDTAWQASTILYNTKKDREVAFSDLFQERFDYQSWFKTQAQKQQASLPGVATDKAYAQWLTTTGFPITYLRPDGLVVSTLFHPVYGTAEVLLPWAEVRPYLRSGSVVKDLVKG